QWVLQLLLTTPTNVRSFWRVLLAEGLPGDAYDSLKSILNYMCTFSLGSWNPSWVNLLSQLALPKVDKYAAVRSGDVVPTVEEEVVLVDPLDEVAASARKRTSSLSDDSLRKVAVLVCTYQFGMRAKQIAMLKFGNVRVWHDGLEATPAVHLTFTMIKQRSARRVFPLVRQVKREWSSFFVELLKRARARGLAIDERLFRCRPRDIEKMI